MDVQPEHHRHSIRLGAYDYSTAGGYFITIVTSGWKCLFGSITGGEVRLTELGRIVRKEWFKTAVLRPYIELSEDEFVVMPNHVHGIIRIMDDDVTVGVRRHDVVGAQRRCAPTRNVMPHSLGAIVRAFKSAVTYRAHRELNFTRIWQRNYYEHIIRDQKDHEKIAGYILANPENWKNDEENPANRANQDKIQSCP